MYTITNFKTKKQLKEAVDHWLSYNGLTEAEKTEKEHIGFQAPPAVKLFAPGIGAPKENGREYVEGPHYPEPHRWYAQVEVKDGIVVKVK